MVAEFLENVDGLQWLGVCATKESLDLRRLDKQPIELQLEVGWTTENDLLVFDRH